MTAPPAPGTILVVDDTPTNLEVLLEILEAQGHETLVATDGLTALEQAAYALPDLILLDVMMPGIDGFETCARLKADPVTAPIPVLFMTALAEAADKVKGLETGAVDYLTKPLQHEEVLARVNTHLSLRRLQQDLEARNAQLADALARIDAQIDEMAGLQQELLPARLPTADGYRLAAYRRSYDRAGGDYYDVLGPDADGSLCLLIADVSGHGPSASVVVAMLHAWLHAQPLPASPAEALALLNARFTRRDMGMGYVTACLARYHPGRHLLTVATAGHPVPLLRRGEAVQRLNLPVSPPLSVLPEWQGRDTHTRLHPGDRVLWYTDGFSETTNPAGDFLDEAGLAALFAAADGPAEAQLAALLEAVHAFENGAVPEDDKALLLLEVTA